VNSTSCDCSLSEDCSDIPGPTEGRRPREPEVSGQGTGRASVRLIVFDECCDMRLYANCARTQPISAPLTPRRVAVGSRPDGAEMV